MRKLLEIIRRRTCFTIRTDGAVIHQRSAGNDFGATGNRDPWILEAVVRSKMTHAQFRNLACTTRLRILVTFAAGLRVVERAQSVFYGLKFIKLFLINLVYRVIHHTIALVVEPGRSFREQAGDRSECKTQTGNC